MGIFLGRALDGLILSRSARMNTIALRDPFKPIRIGENLVVKYNPLVPVRGITRIDSICP